MKTIKFRILILLALVLCSTALFAGDKPWHKNQRPPVLISNERGKMVVDNIRWGFTGEEAEQEHFKRVTIDTEKIKEVLFWTENFPPEWLAAHGMIAFIFEDDSGVVADDGSRDIGFVLSVEARLKFDQSYNLLKGMGKNFGLVYLLTSFTDRIQFAVAMRKHSVSQFKLKLSDKQKRELVRNTIMRSCENRDDAWYNTLTESCVTHATECINTVLPEDKRISVYRIGRTVPNILISFPKTTGSYMIMKGIAERIPALDNNTKTLSFPTTSGEDYVIDLRRLPGYGIPLDVLPFVENLELFLKYAQALDMLERLQMLLSPMDKRFFEYQKEMIRVEEELELCHEALMKILEENFTKNVIYYSQQELPNWSAIKILDGVIDEQIKLRLINGATEEETAQLEEARATIKSRL